MLDTLDHIPWATLEHAYGTAEDIPEKIRALALDDAEAREWAQEKLEMGAFHQGSIYTCTPYVARFLLELVQEDITQEKDWIFSYLSRLLMQAKHILSHSVTQADDEEHDEWAGMTHGEWRRINRQIAQQIADEIQPHLHVFLDGINSSDPEISLSVIHAFTTFSTEIPHAAQTLQQRFAQEHDEIVKTALAFALGTLAKPEAQSMIETVLMEETEPVVVRLGFGFGWIAISKDKTPNSVVAVMTDLIQSNTRALDVFESIYQSMISDTRLLPVLYNLSSEQKARFVQPLIAAYRDLPFYKDSLIRIGQSYYLDALIMMAFPESILPASATINDLNEPQRAVLEAFQTYQLPSVKWNVHSYRDFQDLLGLDVSSKAQFLEFMAGKRCARQAGSTFDQRMIKYWSNIDRRFHNL
jgi:hypothetical protein